MLVQAAQLRQEEQLQKYTWQNKKYVYQVEYTNGLILNKTHQDLMVNYLKLIQIDKKSGAIVYQNEWITDLDLNDTIIEEFCKVARARWKIENETFNTLKNQGYNLEHSYGHGKKYLASVFAILMFVAFLADQILQYADKAFKNALAKCKSKKILWEKIRQVFDLCPISNMDILLKIISKEIKLNISYLHEINKE